MQALIVSTCTCIAPIDTSVRTQENSPISLNRDWDHWAPSNIPRAAEGPLLARDHGAILVSNGEMGTCPRAQGPLRRSPTAYWRSLRHWRDCSVTFSINADLLCWHAQEGGLKAVTTTEAMGGRERG